MQIIETADGDLYAEQADVYKRNEGGQEVWEAYIRVGSAGSKALVIRQRAMGEIDAVRSLVRKLRSFMDLAEGAVNDRFLPVITGALDEQIASLKQALGAKSFGLDDPDTKKDEPS